VTDQDLAQRMKVAVDGERCEGHGRCYAVAPELFEPDEIGNSRVIGDGLVPPALLEGARLAEANCPEHAVMLRPAREG
jgi:ferredoxin